jgi:hypothetical protein
MVEIDRAKDTNIGFSPAADGSWDSDLAPDGKHILAVPANVDQNDGDRAPRRVTVLPNVFEELQRRVSLNR